MAVCMANLLVWSLPKQSNHGSKTIIFPATAIKSTFNERAREQTRKRTRARAIEKTRGERAGERSLGRLKLTIDLVLALDCSAINL